MEFKTIALLGNPNKYNIKKSISYVLHLLTSFSKILVENSIYSAEDLQGYPCLYPSSIAEIKSEADLALVFGGDGGIMHLIKSLHDTSIYIIPIHTGKLGFISEITLDNIHEKLPNILRLEYVEDLRYMLDIHTNGIINIAFNELAIHRGGANSMIDIEVYIDNYKAIADRSDGLIISSASGSTGYSLSTGASILHPNSRSIIISPVSSSSMSARPIIIKDSSKIRVSLISKHAVISIDGNDYFSPAKEILVQNHKKPAIILRTESYNYYSNLRNKLNWFS